MSEMSDQEFELINQSSAVSLQNSISNSTSNSDDEPDQNQESTPKENKIKILTQSWINQTQYDEDPKKFLPEMARMISLLGHGIDFPEKNGIFMELLKNSPWKCSYDVILKNVLQSYPLNVNQIDMDLFLEITTQVLEKYPQTIIIPLNDTSSFNYHQFPDKYYIYLKIRKVIMDHFDSEVQDIVPKYLERFITYEIIRMISKKVNLTIYQRNVQYLVQIFNLNLSKNNLMMDSCFTDFILRKENESKMIRIVFPKTFYYTREQLEYYEIVKYLKVLYSNQLISQFKNAYEYIDYIGYNDRLNDINPIDMIKLFAEIDNQDLLFQIPVKLAGDDSRLKYMIRMFLRCQNFNYEHTQWDFNDHERQIIQWIRQYIEIGYINLSQSEIYWHKYNPQIISYLKIPLTDKITDWTGQKWKQFRESKYYDTWFIGNSFLAGFSLAYIAYLKMKD